MKPRKIPRHPDTLPFPDISLEELLIFDGYLAYFQSVANTAYNKMRQIPKSEREPWYDKNVQRWKHVRGGFKWARGVCNRSIKKHANQRKRRTETVDSTLPRGRDKEPVGSC